MTVSLLDKPLHRLVKLDWEKGLYLLLIILALVTRFWGLGERVQSHDESIHTLYSWNLYTGRGFSHSPMMHGPFLFHATALSYFFFGDNDFTARIPVALMGVAVVALPFFLRRWLGRTGALMASFLLLISPSISYYSRYIRHDIPILLWSLITIWAVFSYLRGGREHWLYVLAGAVSLSFATKEVAYIYNAIVGVFLVGLLLLEVIKGDDRTRTWSTLRKLRVFDLVVVLGTLCFPLLSAGLIQLLGYDPLDYSAPAIYISGAVVGTMLLISVTVGLLWDWRRWSIAAAVYYAIFAVLFTTVFTNGTGIASGMVGALGYWLAQQEVERGSQPWYYYIIMTLFYEYLPLLLTMLTSIYLFIRDPFRSDSPDEAAQSSEDEDASEDEKGEGNEAGLGPALLSRRHDALFIYFLLWWTAMAWLAYSYAGERMPWLTVHLATPMILTSGWLVGRFIEAVDWRSIRRSWGWLLFLLVPPFVAALATTVGAALTGPFAGNDLAQLNVTGQFLGGLIAVLGLGVGCIYIARRSGWRGTVHVLLLLVLVVGGFVTIRTAWRLCYINDEYPTEFLVYAHASPAVGETMKQIDEISRRVAGGPEQLKVAYGADGSTLFYWQLRNYPAVFYGEQPSRESLDAPVVIAGRNEWDEVAPYMERDYIFNTYTFLWWPMEDYRDLSRVFTDTQTFTALWDIWYNRDYRQYDQATGKTHTLDKWPLRAEYRLYIQRDIVAQMWDRGTVSPVEIGPTDPYAEGWRNIPARLVFGSQGMDPGQFERPSGITIGPEGFLYVADTGNHRIQKFTADGQFVAAYGQHATVETEAGMWGFNEPWDVAVAADGAMYVADTWNHRVQKLDQHGDPVAVWGLFGQYSPSDGPAGQAAFYGPRGIAIAEDWLYVTDTGNKRVQAFDPDGEFTLQWGGGGMMQGYLDEPAGIAIGPAGNVYVADTWNRRVQVFDQQGTFLREWPVEGWDTGLADEKPYLAVDEEGYVYVTDPGHYRVLVFDENGEYVLSFGQYGFDQQSFALPVGIAVAADGTIYITDSYGSRVLVFDAVR